MFFAYSFLLIYLAVAALSCSIWDLPFFKNSLTHLLILAVLGLCCCVRPPRVAAHSSSLLRLLLRSTGVVAGAHEFSCSAACGVFPSQGSNPPMVQQINKYGYAHSERSTAMKRVTDANRIKESQTGICGGRVCECACACTWLSIRYTCISRCMCRHLHICTHMCACT